MTIDAKGRRMTLGEFTQYVMGIPRGRVEASSLTQPFIIGMPVTQLTQALEANPPQDGRSSLEKCLSTTNGHVGCRSMYVYDACITAEVSSTASDYAARVLLRVGGHPLPDFAGDDVRPHGEELRNAYVLLASVVPDAVEIVLPGISEQVK